MASHHLPVCESLSTAKLCEVLCSAPKLGVAWRWLRRLLCIQRACQGKVAPVQQCSRNWSRRRSTDLPQKHCPCGFVGAQAGMSGRAPAQIGSIAACAPAARRALASLAGARLAISGPPRRPLGACEWVASTARAACGRAAPVSACLRCVPPTRHAHVVRALLARANFDVGVIPSSPRLRCARSRAGEERLSPCARDALHAL